MPRWLSPWRWPAARLHGLLGAGLLLWAAWAAWGGGGAAIAAATYDQLQRHRLWASPPDPRLLIIDIDERSLAELAPTFGRWPWSRDTLATVLDHAHAEGAAAVVFDILLADPDRARPGGDRALAATLAAAPIAYTAVARLPPALDAASALRADAVPGLARPPAGSTPAAAPTVAAILPFFEAALASGRLGHNSATLDSDGAVRRHALAEALGGGWSLRSLPAAVAEGLGRPPAPATEPRLIVWRERVHAYPRLSFVDALACAEGRSGPACPALRGRVLVVGASATGLHDTRATPLSPQHAGVDVLTTLIDNALHGRAYRELPAPACFGLAVAVLAAAAWRVRQGRAGATRQALVVLPVTLLALGWASLHTEAFYLDLSLPASVGVAYLSGVALLDAARLRWRGRGADQAGGPWAVALAAPSSAAESAERAVLDAAVATPAAVVDGCRATAGEWGPWHSVWRIGGLATAHQAEAVAAALGATGLPLRLRVLAAPEGAPPWPVLLQQLAADPSLVHPDVLEV